MFDEIDPTILIFANSYLLGFGIGHIRAVLTWRLEANPLNISINEVCNYNSLYMNRTANNEGTFRNVQGIQPNKITSHRSNPQNSNGGVILNVTLLILIYGVLTW